MRHLVNATQILVENILKQYADVVSDNSQLAVRIAYLYLSLDTLIFESERGLDLMGDLLKQQGEGMTPKAVRRFNAHVVRVCSAFADCYKSFKSLRSIIWDANPLIFGQLMVALDEKAFGGLEEYYFQSPGYGVDDRAKYEIEFLQAMLHIDYDKESGKYLVGKRIRQLINKARKLQEKGHHFYHGFPMSLDIHKIAKYRMSETITDTDLILRTTDVSLPAVLGSESSINFYTERRAVVKSLTNVKDSLRNYLALLPTFTTDTASGRIVDSLKISEIVQNALSQSISVHIRCDINLYIYSHTSIELSGAVFSEGSVYHSVQELFGRDFDLAANLKRWYPENITYEVASQLGRALFKGVFVDEILDKYHLAREISKTRGATLTLSLKALEANRDMPISFTAPWELMHDEDGFVCLQFPFFRLPRGGKIYPISKVSPEIKDALLIAANPGGGSCDIPEVDEEIKSIANMLKEMKIRVTSIPSYNAKPQFVLQQLEAGVFQVVHFAGHGCFDADHPEDSFLLIGTKDTKPFRLSARTLCEYASHSSLSMVFISSCFSAQQGVSKHLRPWEIRGILDSFVQAGVPTAIGMQWSVSDLGAMVLAKCFYENLKQRFTVEESLRRARIHLGALTNWKDMTWLAPMLIKFPI